MPYFIITEVEIITFIIALFTFAVVYPNAIHQELSYRYAKKQIKAEVSEVTKEPAPIS